MLGLPLDRGGEGDQLPFLEARGDDVGDLGLAPGEGAGLVHDDGVDPGGGLQGGGVLEQHTALRAQASTHHDRGRGGQAERVGAGDDHDGDSEQQRLLDRPSDGEPDQERAEATDQSDEYQPERRPVGQSLTGCLGVLRLLHEGDDLRQGGVGADLGGTHPQRSGGVDRGADDVRAGRLGHRQALPGDHRLVDLGLALLDDTVDRDLGTGSDQQQVSDLHVGGRHLDLAAVAEHDRHRRRQLEQAADGVVRTPSGAHLEPVPEQHEGGQHGGGFVEDLAAAHEGDPDAIEPAGAHSDRDQHHHVQGAGPQCPPRPIEEDPRRVEHDGKAQQQAEHIIAHAKRRRRLEAEHVPADRREEQDRHRQDCRHQEPVAHIADHVVHRHPGIVAAVAHRLMRG